MRGKGREREGNRGTERERERKRERGVGREGGRRRERGGRGREWEMER